MAFPTPHTHDDPAGAEASSHRWIVGRNFGRDDIFAFFFLRCSSWSIARFVIVSLKKNLKNGTYPGCFYLQQPLPHATHRGSSTVGISECQARLSDD